MTSEDFMRELKEAMLKIELSNKHILFMHPEDIAILDLDKVSNVIYLVEERRLEHPGELAFSELDVVNMLNHAPTAFDVAKVVRELKKLKMRYYMTIANTGDADKDCAYLNIANAIDRAIEIVKGGGVDE